MDTLNQLNEFLRQAEPLVIAVVGVIQAVKGWDFFKRKKAEKKAKRTTPPPIPHGPM